MKILVFDDNETHRKGAESQLEGHDLTVVGTYDEARRLLGPYWDEQKVEDILKEKFGKPSDDWSPDKEQEYNKAYAEECTKATVYPDFDVVLTDLLVPASGRMQNLDEKKLVGTEMPVGIFIGLLAAVKARAKYVAVFTDSDHHSHPASACFDSFNGYANERKPVSFTVETSKVLLCNNRNWIIGGIKQWDKLLEYLIQR